MSAAKQSEPTHSPDASSTERREATSWRPRREPSVLSADELSEFEAVLLAEREALLEKARRSWAEDTRFDQNELSDEIDQASAEYVQAMALRLRDREGYYLRKIELALERIRDGSFGTCTECGEPIPVGRLKARPVAMLCAGCKEQQEMIERDFVG
jgi:DnaK suppressor protein